MSPSRIPLVLLHGALQSSRAVEALRSNLAEDHELVTPDLPGHGGRDIPSRLEIEELGRDVLATLDAHGLTSAHLYGYSLGGYVALHLARRAPERVRSVVAHATKLRWTTEVADREARNLDPYTLTSTAPKFVAALERAHPGQDWTVLADRFTDLMRRLGDAPELTGADLAALDTPVQLVVGDRDPLVTLEEAVDAYRSLRRGRLLVLPGTGHPIQSVNPAWLAAEVRAFVGSQERERNA